MIGVSLLFLAALLAPSLEQFTSPCPDVFTYDQSETKPGRWYGTINLSTDSTLHGLWLNVMLDSKADVLMNWVGNVTTEDNIEFQIENAKIKIQPDAATAVHFFVQYSPLDKVPTLKAIRLNGREICNTNIPMFYRSEIQNEPDLPGQQPCSTIFTYDQPGTEPGRWYGTINLSTDSSAAHSLWLNVVLDSRADLLVNWVGNVSTSDNIDFKIENTNMKIQPGTTAAVRFFVKYNPLSKVPRLKAIGFYGRQICSELGTPQSDIAVTNPPPSTTTADSRNLDIRFDEDRDAVPVNNHLGTTVRPSTQDYDDDYRDDNNSDLSNTNPESNSMCGKAIRNAVSLVVNGKPTLEGQWPWQVALYLTETVDSKYICGGTLVSHKHIITAAHCVTRKTVNKPVHRNTLTVYLGKHNLRTSVEGVQIRLVSRISVHPQYKTSSYSRDLSILTLRQPVQYTELVRPACLWPEQQVDLFHVIGKKGSVVGWGFNATGKVTEELTLVEMPVVDQETCLRSYGEFFSRFTSDYTYCAGYKDGVLDENTGVRKGMSVCNGDSGGGMVFFMRDSWYLRGLVSLSVSKNNKCDTSHYIVFTDLAKFLPWIRQEMRD